MNNENILYAFIGGAVVALAWVASVSLTVQSLAVSLGAYSIAAVLALVVQDYRNTAKELK